MAEGARARRGPSKRACPPSQSQAAEVWARLTALGAQPGYVDLGQGKPEFPPTTAAVQAAQAALGEAAPSQYSPVAGAPALLEAVRRFVARSHGAEAAPGPGEIAITASGTEGLFAAFFAALEPGDEVVVPQPCFPWYLPQLRLAGCVPVPLTLKAEEGFEVKPEALRAVITSKTRAVILNTPHNPTGHVCGEAELEAVAQVCIEHDLLAFADDVYERQTWGGHRHRRLADVKGMRERTLTFGSGGKLFCCTGWRVGWVIGPADLVGAVTRVHSYTTYCAPTPMQFGVAAALDSAPPDPADEPFTQLLVANAATLTAALEACGARVIQPQGGYFLVADTAPMEMDAAEFCDRLSERARVVAAPMACFYGNSPDPNLVRFTLCKTAATVQEAAARIREHLGAKRLRTS